MAGPLSSEEIEDVVSSVRRLVSNEQASRRLSRDLNADRLLLTPSLRVVSETSPLAPLVLEAQVADTPPPATPQPPADDPAATSPDDMAEAADLVEAGWEDDVLWSASGTVSLGEVALGADDAEVVLPGAEADDQTAADIEDVSLAAVEEKSYATDNAPIPFVPMHRRVTRPISQEMTSQTPDVAAVAAPDVPTSLTEVGLTEDDLSIAIDNADEAPVSPGPVQDGFDPDARDVWPELAEDLTATGPEGSAPHLSAEIIDADGTALAVLDEAALQEIVRQMIRTELQGDLGERITRNVRKLVRAEINRALMARDLD